MNSGSFLFEDTENRFEHAKTDAKFTRTLMKRRENR